MKNLLFFLSGQCPSLLQQAGPTRRHKAKMDGIAVLIPGLVAIFSYSYTIYLISESKIAAVIGGLVAAFVLIMIDRTIMTADSVWNLGVLGRVILAGAAGYLVAEGLILLCFSDRIDSHLADSVYEQQQVAAVSYDNRITSIEDDITKRNAFLESKQQAVHSEMDGSGGSGIRNQGPIYLKKLADYEELKQQVEIANEADVGLISSVRTEKQERFDSLEAHNATGFFGRLSALQQVVNSDKEGRMIIYVWLLRVLFACIELIPLFNKLSRSSKNDILTKIRISNEKSILSANKELQKGKSATYKLNRRLSDVENRFKLENDHRKKMSKMIGVSSNDKFKMLEDHALRQQRAERNLMKSVKNPIDQERLLEKLRQINDIEISRIMDLARSADFKTSNSFRDDYGDTDINIDDDVSVESDVTHNYDDFGGGDNWNEMSQDKNKAI